MGHCLQQGNISVTCANFLSRNNWKCSYIFVLPHKFSVTRVNTCAMFSIYQEQCLENPVIASSLPKILHILYNSDILEEEPILKWYNRVPESEGEQRRALRTSVKLLILVLFNTLRPRQNGCHFPDNILKFIFLNENVWILIKISVEFVPKGSINNIPALVQIMAWRRPGNKPLSEPMMVRLLMHICMHICIARPQWVNDIQLIT